VDVGRRNGPLEPIDPFASYPRADQYKQYLKSQDAKKAGVGLVLSGRFGYVGVVDVVPGSSAWKQGLTTGDMLESINGVGTRDMPLKVIPVGGRFQVGKFDIELVPMSHSVPETSALAIRTPAGLVFHTADWKLDKAPFVGRAALVEEQ